MLRRSTTGAPALGITSPLRSVGCNTLSLVSRPATTLSVSVVGTATPLNITACRGLAIYKSRSAKVRKRALANHERRAAKQADSIRNKMLAQDQFKLQKQQYKLEQERIKEINRRARARLAREHEGTQQAEAVHDDHVVSAARSKVMEAEIV